MFGSGFGNAFFFPSRLRRSLALRGACRPLQRRLAREEIQRLAREGVHERELRITLQRDEKESAAEGERYTHLEHAMENYLLCLRRAASNSPASRAAASAVVRLWMRNREHARLSQLVQGALASGLDGRTAAFLPLAGRR